MGISRKMEERAGEKNAGTNIVFAYDKRGGGRVTVALAFRDMNLILL